MTGLQRSRPWTVWAAAAAFCLLYARVFVDLVRNWIRDETYSHGFLILPLVAYLVWQRRERFRAADVRPSAIGLVIVACSLAVLLVGTAGVEFFLMRTSAIGVVVGSIVWIWGWSRLRVLRFPMIYSLLMIPLPAIIFYQISFPLQLLATRFGVAVLEAARIPVLREGNMIILARTTLEVAEACSGIRSLVALFALAVMYAHVADTRFGRRVLIVLSSVPIAIVANGIRVAGTGVAAHFIGAEAATGFLHAFSGGMVFVASLLLLTAVVRAMRLFDSVGSIGAPSEAVS